MTRVTSVRGEPDQAVNWLEKAHACGFNWVRQHRGESHLANLHDDSRYRALGETMTRELAIMRRESQSIVTNLHIPIGGTEQGGSADPAG